MAVPVPNPTTPFWLNPPSRLTHHRTTPALPPTTDVAIIGSGFSAAATTYYLTLPRSIPLSSQSAPPVVPQSSPSESTASPQSPSPSILLLEARTFCSGATGRNGGHLKPDLYFNASRYSARFGTAASVSLATYETEQLFALKSLIEREGIECAFELTRSIDVYTHADVARDVLATYHRLRDEEGYVFARDLHVTSEPGRAERVSGVKGAKATFSSTAGSCWPAKLVEGLVERAMARGRVNLQTGTTVLGVERVTAGEGRGHGDVDGDGLGNADAGAGVGGNGNADGNGHGDRNGDGLADADSNANAHAHANANTTRDDAYWLVRTDRGDVRARKVVIANNAYAPGVLPLLAGRITPARGVCCRIATPDTMSDTTTNRASHLHNTYSIRFAPKEYDYLIPRTDGSIIVGGAKQVVLRDDTYWHNNVDDANLIPGAREYFSDYMQRIFHGWEASGARVTDIWTGVMGYSADLMPWVGEVPGMRGLYVTAGFTGHGMPRILGCSEAVARLIRGEIGDVSESGLPSPFWITEERLARREDMAKEYMAGEARG